MYVVMIVNLLLLITSQFCSEVALVSFILILCLLSEIAFLVAL